VHGNLLLQPTLILAKATATVGDIVRFVRKFQRFPFMIGGDCWWAHVEA